MANPDAEYLEYDLMVQGNPLFRAPPQDEVRPWKRQDWEAIPTYQRAEYKLTELFAALVGNGPLEGPAGAQILYLGASQIMTRIIEGPVIDISGPQLHETISNEHLLKYLSYSCLIQLQFWFKKLPVVDKCLTRLAEVMKCKEKLQIRAASQTAILAIRVSPENQSILKASVETLRDADEKTKKMIMFGYLVRARWFNFPIGKYIV